MFKHRVPLEILLTLGLLEAVLVQAVLLEALLLEALLLEVLEALLLAVLVRPQLFSRQPLQSPDALEQWWPQF